MKPLNYLVKFISPSFHLKKHIILAAFCPLLAQASIANEDFTQCKSNLAQRAQSAGFSPYITKTVINNISPIERVITLDKKQPEFTQTFEQYIKTRVSAYHLRVDKKKLKQNKALFDSLESKYGIQRKY